MRILLTGATGLLGTALTEFFAARGDVVLRVSRRSNAGPGWVRWDPSRREIAHQALDQVEAVIHLAGANLASGRWTARRKRELVDSRVDTTRWLVEIFEARPPADRPRVFLCASGAGFYGDTGDVAVDETAPGGTGFVADLCRAWEAEAGHAGNWGARVVTLRTAMVLAANGGALVKLLPFFRAGLGGQLGDGRQWVSWIALDDVVHAVAHILATGEIAGPVNLAAPEAVTNHEFTRTLARVLRRPAILPVPAFALRTGFGEMARETVLMSSRVVPAKLRAAGYAFRFPGLEAALRRVLGRG